MGVGDDFAFPGLRIAGTGASFTAAPPEGKGGNASFRRRGDGEGEWEGGREGEECLEPGPSMFRGRPVLSSPGRCGPNTGDANGDAL